MECGGVTRPKKWRGTWKGKEKGALVQDRLTAGNEKNRKQKTLRRGKKRSFGWGEKKKFTGEGEASQGGPPKKGTPGGLT